MNSREADSHRQRRWCLSCPACYRPVYKSNQQAAKENKMKSQSLPEYMVVREHYFVRASGEDGGLVKYRTKTGQEEVLIAQKPLQFSLVKVLICASCSARVGLEHLSFGNLHSDLAVDQTPGQPKTHEVQAFEAMLHTFFNRAMCTQAIRIWSLNCIYTSDDQSEEQHGSMFPGKTLHPQALVLQSKPVLSLEEAHNRFASLRKSLSILLNSLHMLLSRLFPSWTSRPIWDTHNPLKDLASLRKQLIQAREALSSTHLS